MDDTTFPFGYIFNFTFPEDITINTKSLKGSIPYEFKIKKGTGNSLTLEQAWTDDNTFTKKAGLDCTNSNTSGCTVSSDSQKLNVKVGHLKKEGVTTVTTGKIKMEKDQPGYNQGLKFSIDGGNAELTGGTGDEITKLEELETYEIAEYGGKYYLTKKTSPDQLIKTSLGIKDVCDLPTTDTPVSCNLDEGKFKAINFEGKDTGKPSGSATLTISKANSTDFPFGYKFTFKTETADAEIKSDTKIKAKIPKDFKIKKGSGTGQSVSLSLEKAWDDSNYSLAAKVGLTCTSSDGSGDVCCTKSTSGSAKLNVKKGNDKKEDITTVTTTDTAKIKVEKDQEGYNQGLKFTITGGDVSLTGGNKVGDSADFSTLEELETYEITEDKGKYYLTRKTSKEDVLKKSLSIPENCFTSLGTSCSISSQDLQKIQFDNKDSNAPTMVNGTASLTVTKANSTDFPLGYRFTFNTTAEATIKSGTTTIKANIPTDFKIKKATEGGSLSLEKAWKDDDYSFAKKVGLECNTSGSDGCCTKTNGGSVKLNVKKGNDKKHDISSIDTSGSGKIKVEKEQAGYNQGLKFTITGGNVSLSGGTKADGSTDITKLDEYETYEITEEGGKYYLTRKSGPEDMIKSSLSLPEGCELPTSSSGNKICSLTTDTFKKINFDGKETDKPTGTATLTIAKVDSTDFPMGYKFTFNTTADATIKTNSTTIKAKIPTDFKIKKGGSGQATLSLEKAWTEETLGKKVGLTCNNSNNNECTINGSNLKVRQSNNGQDVKEENLTKKSGSSGNAKIKVTKDQEGYNQGFKFEIEGGSIELDGAKSSGQENDKINILDEYETYEIKEDGGKWYLTRKHESIVFLKKQLGLDFCSENSWQRINSSSSGNTISFNCDSIKDVANLKKIKIHNKSGHDSKWPTGNISVKVMITKKKGSTSSFGDWDVEIEDDGSDAASVCVPDGAGGSVDLKGKSGSISNTAKYKINKGSGSGGSWCLTKSGNNSGQCSVS